MAGLMMAGSPIQAQEIFLTNPDSLNHFFDSNSVIISVSGGVYQQSNSITNSFVNKFINGGFIDDELKSDQKLSTDDNLFGGGFQFGINAMIVPDSLFGTDRYGWKIGLSHHDDLSGRFTRDIFNATFYGNKMFAGESISLSNSGFRYQRFQQLNIGFFEKSTLSFVSLGVLNGNQFIDVGVDNGGLFTAPNGEYVELEADGQVLISDTGNAAGLTMNGIGAALSFEINIPFYFEKRPERPSYLRFGGENVGFTRWDKQTVKYSVDSTYNYQGFVIDDLAEFDNVTEQVDNVVDSLLPESSTSPYVMTTPGWLYLSWFSPLGKSLFYEVELRTKTYAYHLPELRATVFYKPTSNWLVGVNASYGGYGLYEGPSAFRAGIFLNTFIGEHFMISAQSHHFLGWFMPEARGRSARVGLNYFF